MGRHRVRVVPPLDHVRLVEILRKLDVDEGGVRIMAPKGIHRLLWVEGFSTRGANILKQEMLARGGEVALPRAASLLSGKTTSCLIMGTLSQLRSLVAKLRGQAVFGLAGLAEEIETALAVTEEDLRWDCRGRIFDLGERSLIMGILNVTPDSFSDGGRYHGLTAAVERAKTMAKEGAVIIDVGGESTRPGAPEVPVAEELARVLPVVEALVAELDLPVSVDTRRGEVAQRVLDAGASLINDVSGDPEPELLRAVAEHGAGLVLMHNGRGRTYTEFWSDVYRGLAGMLEGARAAGIGEEKVAVDPGIGFGKTVEQNLELVRGVGSLSSLGRPILLGPSRKSFIGAALDLPVEERLEGTLACVAVGVFQGAHILRVHDVRAGARVARLADRLRGRGEEELGQH